MNGSGRNSILGATPHFWGLLGVSHQKPTKMTEIAPENMTPEGQGKPRTYLIPEIREPTLFDYIVAHIIPEIFRFTQYVTLTGFIFYLAMKINSKPLYAFAFVLYACVYWYVMDKCIAFVKKLEFRHLWTMRLTSWLLVVVNALIVTAAGALALAVGAAQLGQK